MLLSLLTSCQIKKVKAWYRAPHHVCILYEYIRTVHIVHYIGERYFAEHEILE